MTAKAVKSGAVKDMGSPLKPLDDNDLTVIQGMFDEYYKRFVDVVGRWPTVSSMPRLAIPRQAKAEKAGVLGRRNGYAQLS